MSPISKSPIPKCTLDHSLDKVNNGEGYTCDGCNTTGSGTRFSCQPCGFDLHEYCATCPDILSSFTHPQHPPQHPPLNLVRRPQTTRHNDRECNVCGQCIQGLFYMCSVCEFDVHPMCTQQPSVPPAAPLSPPSVPPAAPLPPPGVPPAAPLPPPSVPPAAPLAPPGVPPPAPLAPPSVPPPAPLLPPPFGIPYGVQCPPAPPPLGYSVPCPPYACYCVGYGFRVCRFR